MYACTYIDFFSVLRVLCRRPISCGDGLLTHLLWGHWNLRMFCKIVKNLGSEYFWRTFQCQENMFCFADFVKRNILCYACFLWVCLPLNNDFGSGQAVFNSGSDFLPTNTAIQPQQLWYLCWRFCRSNRPHDCSIMGQETSCWSWCLELGAGPSGEGMRLDMINHGN